MEIPSAGLQPAKWVKNFDRINWIYWMLIRGILFNHSRTIVVFFEFPVLLARASGWPEMCQRHYITQHGAESPMSPAPLLPIVLQGQHKQLPLCCPCRTSHSSFQPALGVAQGCVVLCHRHIHAQGARVLSNVRTSSRRASGTSFLDFCELLAQPRGPRVSGRRTPCRRRASRRN